MSADASNPAAVADSLRTPLDEARTRADSTRAAHDALLREIVARASAILQRADPLAASVLGNSGSAPIDRAAFLATLVAELRAVAAANSRIAGTGTAEDPFVVSQGPLYVRAPITLVVAGLSAGQMSVTTSGRTVSIASQPAAS